ncbi:uncharacterized protein J3R85_018048 [Psidium guajava]|nr:uncharacterized protein J3R85_018048 [Psidium guajava]
MELPLIILLGHFLFGYHCLAQFSFFQMVQPASHSWTLSGSLSHGSLPLFLSLSLSLLGFLTVLSLSLYISLSVSLFVSASGRSSCSSETRIFSRACAKCKKTSCFIFCVPL